jgi:uncharacterized protein DUF3311
MGGGSTLAETRQGSGIQSQPAVGSRRGWYALLAIPFAALLPVPIYASADPELFGFPFFYWYQLAWVPITALIVWFVYTRTR